MTETFEDWGVDKWGQFIAVVHKNCPWSTRERVQDPLRFQPAHALEDCSYVWFHMKHCVCGAKVPQAIQDLYLLMK